MTKQELDNFEYLQEVLAAHPMELTLCCSDLNKKGTEWMVRYRGPLEPNGRAWVDENFAVLSRQIKDWYAEKAKEEAEA